MVSSRERTDDAAPPGASRGLVWRALLAGLLIALSTAGAVYASVQLLADDLLPNDYGYDIPELKKPENGEPQTLMLIGSDHRVTGGERPRSDTIMLIRLDPDAKATTVTSIPRDLLVDIPGIGDDVKINAAYEQDRERGTVRVVKRLLSTPERTFEINHVITADFTGFRETIDDVGCVYVDVDRDYFNDRGGPGGYAVIDIDPGYQKLCGKDALAYVRYRHGDNDIVRGTRQQEFLRQFRRQPGVEALMRPDDLGTLRRIGRMARRSLRVDRTLRGQRALFDFAEAAMYSATLPVRNVPFEVAPAPGDPNSLVASRAMRRRTVDAFLGETPERAKPEKERKRTPRGGSSPAPELVDVRTQGEDLAIVAAPKVGFPFRFPARLPKNLAYVSDPVRTYTLRDADGKEHDAYRLTFSTNRVGEYVGVQGMTWTDPPILEEPSRTVRRRGRTLRVYGDGGRTRMVAWRTRGAVYWVSNTLTRSLSERELIGIAGSLARFGG